MGCRRRQQVILGDQGSPDFSYSLFCLRTTTSGLFCGVAWEFVGLGWVLLFRVLGKRYHGEGKELYNSHRGAIVG